MKRFYLFFYLALCCYQVSFSQTVITYQDTSASVVVPDECTVQLRATTRDGGNNFNRDNYRNCISTNVYNNNRFTGRDDIYSLGDRFDFTKAVTIRILARSNNRDIDLFVMDGSTCIASSLESGGKAERLSFPSWRSSYRIIVDGYDGNQNTDYTIEVTATCKEKNPTSNPCNVSTRTITCNNTVSGNTRNESNDLLLDSYTGSGCFNNPSATFRANNPFTGGDVVYRLSGVNEGQTVTLNLNANTDLDMFIYRCIDAKGGVCVSADGASGPTGNESVTIAWSSSYVIVIDGPNPSDNGPYTLRAQCAVVNPCEGVPTLTSDCNQIDYNYKGTTGTLTYEFSVPNSLPANGSWTASQNESVLNLGSGRSRTFTFSRTGKYIICYRYKDSNGCDRRCCKTIYIDNPYTCNALNKNKQGNNYILSLSSVSSSDVACWSFAENTNCLRSRTNQYTVPVPERGQCRRYCVKYFDRSLGCYRICCIEVCGDICDTPNANITADVPRPDCNKINYLYKRSNGGLSYQFTVPNSLPSNGTWQSKNANGTVVNLGTGRTITYRFPSEGRYLICYKYQDSNGCDLLCCRWIYIRDPYQCSDIVATPIGSNYRLNIPGVNSSDILRWVDDENGNVINTNSSQITVPIPPSGRCRYYSVTYYDPICDCYRICCIKVCGSNCPTVPTLSEGGNFPSCDFIDYSYNRSAGGLSYRLNAATNLPNNGTWEARTPTGSVANLGSGRTRNYTFPSEGRYLICYTYFDSNNCKRVCCRWIYINNPFNCEDIVATPIGNNFQLFINGVSSTNIQKWVDDETGNVLSTSSAQITIPVPEPDVCKYYSVTYYDPICDCYRICCIRVCGPSTNGKCCTNGDATLNNLIDIYRNVCECGVKIFCFDNGSIKGYFVYTAFACCTKGTGTIIDCDGRIRGVIPVPTGPFANTGIRELVWDGCNTTNPTINSTGETSKPTFLSDYTWLSEKVDFDDCDGTSIEIHEGGSNKFVYVIKPESSILYNPDGSVWCTSSIGFNCLNFYSNGKIDSWNCSDNLTTDPCKTNPADCVTQRIGVGDAKDAYQTAVKVYPNPSRGTVFVDFPFEEAIQSIKVFDISGKLVETFEGKGRGSSDQIELDISAYSGGMYLIQIDAEHQRVTKRIVLE